jgi:chromosome segregation ATPase
VRTNPAAHRPVYEDGLELRVAFEAGRPKRWAELSGGQRSVVALCIIFAVHAIGPSPFYIFDEVDAALDPKYREALRRLIEARMQTRQYLVTSFRQEMTDLAGEVRMFEVTMERRQSHVTEVSADEGRGIIEATSRLTL